MASKRPYQQKKCNPRDKTNRITKAMVVTVKQQDNAFTLASSYGTVTEEILNQTTEISIIYGNFYTAPYWLLCLLNIWAE